MASSSSGAAGSEARPQPRIPYAWWETEEGYWVKNWHKRWNRSWNEYEHWYSWKWIDRAEQRKASGWSRDEGAWRWSPCQDHEAGLG